MADPANANRSAIPLQFENVSLSFGEEPVLKNISFEVKKGESLVVLGAAASGKTVLLKLALGLLRADSGRICVFGKDATEFDEPAWYEIRSRIGVLFQEGGLFDSLTIEENVSYPLRNHRSLHVAPEEIQRRVEESLEFVELGHTLAKFPAELSGGMRRRVGIARAIVTQPDLLIYDSPTAGLDPITANTIIALVVKSRDVRHTTTVMVTHRFQDGEMLSRYYYDPRSAALRPVLTDNGDDGERSSTRYLVLREGEVAFLGTPAELEASTDPYVSKFKRRG